MLFFKLIRCRNRFRQQQLEQMTANLSYQPRASANRPGASGRVKLDELAAHLGLSKSTVSRALNDYPDISEVTRNRVKAAARKLGYRPLSHAQAIRTGQVRAIAMVLNSDEPDQHNPFLQDFLAGACEAASNLDWTMTISTATSERDTLKVLNRLYRGTQSRRIHPAANSRSRMPELDLLRNLEVPHILYGRTGYGQPERLVRTGVVVRYRR